METISNSQEAIRIDELIEAHIINYLIDYKGRADASSLFEGVARELRVDGEHVAASMWDLQADGIIQYEADSTVSLLWNYVSPN